MLLKIDGICSTKGSNINSVNPSSRLYRDSKTKLLWLPINGSIFSEIGLIIISVSSFLMISLI